MAQAESPMGFMQESYDPKKYRAGIWLCSLWYFPKFSRNFYDLTDEERKYAEATWWLLRDQTITFLEKHFSSKHI